MLAKSAVRPLLSLRHLTRTGQWKKRWSSECRRTARARSDLANASKPTWKRCASAL
jgi:hypothetical protein